TVCPPETTTAQLQKRKPGRPPIGERAMTDAQRQQRRRANQQPERSSPQERPQPGAPTPHRPAPGTYLELDAMTKDFLEKLHERLGDVLNRLKDAPPDYLVCGEDFRVLAIAATIRQRLH